MSLAIQAPVVSLISDEIFARLQDLASSSVGPYSFTGVERPRKLATYTPHHGLIVLTRGESVRLNELDCPGNPPAIAWQQTFLIRVHIAPSEKDPTPIERYEDVSEAEIIHTSRGGRLSMRAISVKHGRSVAAPAEANCGFIRYCHLRLAVTVWAGASSELPTLLKLVFMIHGVTSRCFGFVMTAGAGPSVPAVWPPPE